MKKELLEEFRTHLTQRLESLLRDAGKTVSEMTDQKDNFPDPTDRASVESDRNFELRIRDRERKLISKIRETLARIDDEEFGACEICGEDIGLQRLRARPEATLCIECKTEQERKEKLG
jgi:RNA polymerase-binding transcription factor